MTAKKTWAEPKLTSFGSLHSMTAQTTEVNKSPGGGDTVVLNVPNGDPITIGVPGSLESVNTF